MNQRQPVIKTLSTLYAIQKVLMHIFGIPRRLRQHTKLMKLLESTTSFIFGHRRIGFNAFNFRITPLKELLFFKALISRLQFHSVCTIGENF